MKKPRGQSISVVVLILLAAAAFLLFFVPVNPQLKALLLFTIAAGIFFIAFIDTDLALIILIFSMLLSPEFRTGDIPGRSVVIRAEDVLLFIVFFGWISKTAINKDLGLLRKTALNAPIFFYLLICLLSSLISVLTRVNLAHISFFHLLKYLEYFLLYFMVVNNLRTKEQARRFVFFLLVTCMIVSVWAIFQIPGGERLSAPFEGKGGEPNTFAGYLLLMIALITGLLVFSETLTVRLAYAGMMCVALVTFVFTLSRGGWLGFFPMILIFLLLGRRMKIPLILILLAGIIALPSVIPRKAQDRFHATFNPEKTVDILGKEYTIAESAAARIESWGVAFEKLRQRPLFGHGVPSGWTVDSQYTRVLGEVGLLGFAVFVWMLTVLFRCGLRTYRAVRDDPFAEGVSLGFIAGLSGLVVMGFSAAVFIIIRIMEPFWFLAAIVVALPELEGVKRRVVLAEDNT